VLPVSPAAELGDQKVKVVQQENEHAKETADDGEQYEQRKELDD
jgi:hypothetical protein